MLRNAKHDVNEAEGGIVIMVPERLKSLRIQAGLSQEKLAVMAGIDESTARSRISQYENGVYHPKFEQVCQFARVFDVPVCYFYADDDELATLILSYHQAKKSHSSE